MRVPTPRTDVPEGPLVDFDILDQPLSAPHSRLAELRETCPVGYVPHYEGQVRGMYDLPIRFTPS